MSKFLKKQLPCTLVLETDDEHMPTNNSLIHEELMKLRRCLINLPLNKSLLVASSSEKRDLVKIANLTRGQIMSIHLENSSGQIKEFRTMIIPLTCGGFEFRVWRIKQI